jgi:hypothetical protein
MCSIVDAGVCSNVGNGRGFDETWTYLDAFLEQLGVMKVER